MACLAARPPAGLQMLRFFLRPIAALGRGAKSPPAQYPVSGSPPVFRERLVSNLQKMRRPGRRISALTALIVAVMGFLGPPQTSAIAGQIFSRNLRHLIRLAASAHAEFLRGTVLRQNGHCSTMVTYGEFSSLLQLGVGIGIGLSIFKAPIDLRTNRIGRVLDAEILALRGGASDFTKQKRRELMMLRSRFLQVRGSFWNDFSAHS